MLRTRCCIYRECPILQGKVFAPVPETKKASTFAALALLIFDIRRIA